MRSKYINTFDTTADYENYIDSALPEFPNVGYDKQAGEVNIRRTSPNDYQIWGTTTATSNFNIRLNNTDVEVTVDPLTGEFYLTGWTGTLTSLSYCFSNKTHITSIKKFALDTSQVTSLSNMFQYCTGTTYINLSGCNFSNVTNISEMFANMQTNNRVIDLSGIDFSNVTRLSTLFNTTYGKHTFYITVEATLNKLTGNLTGTGINYIPTNSDIYYNDVLYTWQNNAWTPQS